jgi:hypothetical protein
MVKKLDHALEALIDLNGYIAELGEGYWVKFEARIVDQDADKPHGIKYSLTLHDSLGNRILGYDNAHSIPGKPSIKTHDHMHKGNKIVRYAYKDAAQLLEDFWQDVDRILRRKQ